MGFELDRLLKQYGVSTPGRIAYSGDAPTADVAAYNKEYAARMQNTPMYMQAQYQTGTEPKSEGYDWALKHQGLDTFNKDIKDWAAKNQDQNAKTDDINAFAKKYNLGPQDIFNATGSRWGNVLQAPKSSEQPAPAPTPAPSPAPTPAPADPAPSPLGLTGAKPDVPVGWFDEPTKPAPAPTPAPTTPAPTAPAPVSNPNGMGAFQPSTPEAPTPVPPTTEAPPGYQWVAPRGQGMDAEVNYILQPKAPEQDWSRGDGMAKGGSVGSPSEYDEAAPTPVDLRDLPVGNDIPLAKTPLESLAQRYGAGSDGFPMLASGDGIASTTQASSPSVSDLAPTSQAGPPVDDRLGGLQSLLAAYGSANNNVYGDELKATRANAKSERDTFSNMVAKYMQSPDDANSSKAEMYLRMAAAFGAPTKSGHFMENLGMATKEMADYKRGERTDRQQKMGLAMKVQEMNMTGAKEDLRALQGLSAEEMKDRRATTLELIKSYIASGEPKSTAGKQAFDEGLKPGTPEYEKRVEVIGNNLVEARMAQIQVALGGLANAQGTLALNQAKLENQKVQSARLTSAEMHLKSETETGLADTRAAMSSLQRAYELNPRTFDASLIDQAQRIPLEAVGFKNEKIIATREMENSLGRVALAMLKPTFPGAISDGERRALMALQGTDAKSVEERGKIISNAMEAIRAIEARLSAKLKDINAGRYRDTNASDSLRGGQ